MVTKKWSLGTTATESWYQYERDTPNVNNPVGQTLTETGANGAVCNSITEVTCFAPEWAVLNYTEKQLSRHDYLSIRNEYFDDIRGQRTGFRTPYLRARRRLGTLGRDHAAVPPRTALRTILQRPRLRQRHSQEPIHARLRRDLILLVRRPRIVV